jgi:uncharacterized protein YggE
MEDLRMGRVLLPLAVILACNVAVAEEVAQPAVGSQIVVTGSASVSVPPFKASFDLQVESSADTAKAAAEENAQRSKMVRAALSEVMPKTARVISSRLDVSPRWEQSPNRAARRVGVNAVNTISVETEDLVAIGLMIDAALGAGASGVSDIRFEPKDGVAARHDALRKAVQVARAEAEVVAQASGGTLGELLLVSTRPVRGGALDEIVVTGARISSEREVVQTDVTPREIVIRSEVEARWRFAPASR